MPAVRGWQEGGGQSRPQGEVVTAAAAGFRRWVVYQARQRLKGEIVDTDHGRSAHNCWRLAVEPGGEDGDGQGVGGG